MTHPTQFEATTDWRTYAEELDLDRVRIEARLGRALDAMELEELEELDDIRYCHAHKHEPTITLSEFAREHGLDRPDSPRRRS